MSGSDDGSHNDNNDNELRMNDWSYEYIATYMSTLYNVPFLSPDVWVAKCMWPYIYPTHNRYIEEHMLLYQTHLHQFSLTKAIMGLPLTLIREANIHWLLLLY